MEQVNKASWFAAFFLGINKIFQAPKRGEFRTPASSAASGKDIFGDKNTSLLNAAAFETAPTGTVSEPVLL
jgi:hypothetical protein